MSGGPADKQQPKAPSEDEVRPDAAEAQKDDEVWKRMPRPSFEYDKALARAAGFQVDVVETGPVAPTCIRDTLQPGDETRLRKQLEDFFDGSVTRYQDMEDSLREFELGVFAEEQTVKNLETLTLELPHHFGQFKFPPDAKETGCQAQDVGMGSWMEHTSPGWVCPSLARFLQPPDLKNRQASNKTNLKQLNKVILEIFSERVAHSLSRDFADLDEEQINIKLGKQPAPGGKAPSAWSTGNKKPTLADPWMIPMMENVREDKVQTQRFTLKLSAARHMAVFCEPAHAVNVSFPDFVLGFFVKMGFRHNLGDFVRSVAHEVASGTTSSRVNLFWKLCQLDSSDYIKDATANRLFATIGSATREVVHTQISNQSLQRQFLKDIVEGRHVLAVWKEKSHASSPHVGFPQKPLETACRACLPGITKKHLTRMSAKAHMHMPKKDGQPEHSSRQPEHSSRRQVDFDNYLSAMAGEMDVIETQQIWSFERLYWRLSRRYATAGNESTEVIEVPPQQLQESLCLFTGFNFEPLFYHLYAQSIILSEPGDSKGVFNSRVFVELLLHHNINLCRLVASLSFMFHLEQWKQKLLAEGKLKARARKSPKKPGKKGRSPSPNTEDG
jgi:hypothetical protein